MRRLIDLKVDFAFKQIFGKAGNEHILMSFLNAALRLPPGEQITSVEFLNTELPRTHFDDKASQLDLFVKTEKDVHINVEIQLANRYDMEKRTLFYWSRIFIMQMKKQMSYRDLSKTITINLLDFRFFSATDRFHTTFHLYEDQDDFPLTDLLEIHFMEIPKVMDKWRQQQVNPTDDELVRWLLLLEAHDDEGILQELEAIAMKDPVIDDLFDQWEDMSYDNKKWFQYESLRKAHWDAVSDQYYKEQFEKEKELFKQEKELFKQDKELLKQDKELLKQDKELLKQETETVKQELEAAKQETETVKQEAETVKQEAEALVREAAEREKEAALKGVQEVAKRLLQLGMDVALVAQGTGLSIEEIEHLRQDGTIE